MRGWLLSLVVVLVGFGAPQGARAETLADALIAAYKNSNLLDQNRAVLRAADEGVAEAVSALRPVVGYTLQGAWQRADVMGLLGPSVSEGLSASLALSAEMTIWDAGRRQIGIEIARESVLATRQALIDVEQNVLLFAVQSYVNVRLAQEVVALRQSNLRLITQELRAAQDRFDVGEITRTDVSIAEARLAASRAALAAAEGQLMIAREAYKAATGAYPRNLAPLPKAPALPRTMEEAQAVARGTHPSIRQAQHQVTVADLQVDLAVAGRAPTIGLGATLRTDDEDKQSQSLGLTMNQTLYAGGRLSSLQRRALAGKDSARAGLQQTAVGVLQNVGVAWANLAVAAASIQASDLQIRAAQAAFDGVREEAAAGTRTTLDVLDAEQELLDARNARLEAEAQRYVAVYQVLATMGLLTVEHLQLGIPTYDPEAYYGAVEKAPAHSAQGKKLDRILEKIGN
ncbi:TolC family outer membrane protein [Tabrizicola sp.]|uniref:TolC family outer membrane protein n=1 Tax=Tabrizicola sp. TaxID=2005166 RepID=UPI0027349095|nr:TolC family outer membrane protein [Tabrizicola sp.]MDP3194570.1 TolC family outer membrane protein [Tabrizicola sp.]